MALIRSGQRRANPRFLSDVGPGDDGGSALADGMAGKMYGTGGISPGVVQEVAQAMRDGAGEVAEFRTPMSLATALTITSKASLTFTFTPVRNARVVGAVASPNNSGADIRITSLVQGGNIFIQPGSNIGAEYFSGDGTRNALGGPMIRAGVPITVTIYNDGSSSQIGWALNLDTFQSN